MDEEFRRRANVDFARLLEHWRSIEHWLKRAEQVNQSAIIPAINELRYASRQMMNATIRMGQESLSGVDQKHIEKRIIIAEQYLLNADHDISDSIASFYAQITHALDREIGPSTVSEYYIEYPFFRQKLAEVEQLIVEARHSYDKRRENYDKLKADHLPYLIDSFAALRDAEIQARHQKQKVDAELVRAQAKVNLLTIFNYLGFGLTVLSFIVAFYFWAYAKSDFCKAHGNHRWLSWLCEEPTLTSGAPSGVKSPAAAEHGQTSSLPKQSP